jgi:ABC-type lipoprotein release transport system permease subunit
LTKETSKLEIDSLIKQQSELRTLREDVFSIVVPVIGICCMLSISLLTYQNVRARTYELGLLMSLGLKASTVIRAYIVKSLLSSAIGVVLGFLFFYIIFIIGGATHFHYYSIDRLEQFSGFLLAIVIMPLLTVLSTWLPSLWASLIDPAEVLRHE